MENLTKRIMEWSHLFIYPSPWTIFVTNLELLKVLRWNFDLFNIFSLVILLGQNDTPLYRLRLRQCLILKEILRTNYLTFWNNFFGS